MSDKKTGLIITAGGITTMLLVLLLLHEKKEKPKNVKSEKADDDFMMGEETERKLFQNTPPPTGSKVEGYLQYLLGAAPGLLASYWATRQNRAAAQPLPNPNTYVTREDLREVINTIDHSLRSMRTENNKEILNIKDKLNEVISKFNEDIKNKKSSGKVKESTNLLSDMPFRPFTGYSNKELNLLVTKQSNELGRQITEELRTRPRNFISPVSVHREETQLRELEEENDILNLNISEELETLDMLSEREINLSTSENTLQILDNLIINLNTIINENGRITQQFNELLNDPNFRQEFDTNTLIYLQTIRDNMINEIGEVINNQAREIYRSLITLGEPINIESQLGIHRDFNLEVSRILQKYYKKILKTKNITKEQKQQILKKFFDDLNKNTYMPAIESISRRISLFYNKLINRTGLFTEIENIQRYYRDLQDQLLREAQELKENLSKGEQETEEDRAIHQRITEIIIEANKLSYVDIKTIELIAEFNKLQLALLTGDLKEHPKLVEKYRQMLLDPTINAILTQMRNEKLPIIYDLFNI